MKTRKTLIHATILMALAMSTSSYAGSVNEKLYDLHKRVQELESSQTGSNSNIQIHGVVEAEYGYTQDVDYTLADTSDIVLATVELVIDAKVNNNVDVQVALLYEEDDTPLEVDSGIIMMHDDNLPLTLSMGQMYVPFGVYESNMISDPLTLELGETRESAVQLSFESNGATAGLYVFNGDVEEGLDEDKVTQFGIALGFGNDNFSVGVDYISAISDTDAVQDFLGVPAIIKQVAGISAHAVYNTDAMSMIVEYVGALDKFDASEIVFNGNGAQPAAANVEFGFNFPVAGRDSTVAIGYQVTEEAWDLGLPESRAMIAFSMGLYEATSLSFEYLSDSDYEPVDGGSGESSSTFTVQLAAEF